MIVKELKDILSNFDDDTKVVGVDWHTGEIYAISVNDDDASTTERICIAFEQVGQ